MLNDFFQRGFLKVAMSGGQAKNFLTSLRQATTSAERASVRKAMEEAAPTLQYSGFGAPKLVPPKAAAPAVPPPAAPKPQTTQAPMGWSNASDKARQQYLQQKATGIEAERNLPKPKPLA